MYAGSQIQLLKVLNRIACECDLQIVFTSHSLEVLEYLKSQEQWGYKINFLVTEDNDVYNHPEYMMSDIRNSILIGTDQEEKIPPIYILCEDQVATDWCNSLLNGSQIRKRFDGRLKVGKLPCGSGVIKNLATTNHALFKGVVFVLDADCRGDRTYEKCPRTVIPTRRTRTRKGTLRVSA